MQLRKRGCDVRRLLTEDCVCAPGDAGIEEHELALERPAVDRGELDLVGEHMRPGTEVEIADASERGDVLVLLADPLAAKLDFDRASLLGELLCRTFAGLGMPRERAAGRR